MPRKRVEQDENPGLEIGKVEVRGVVEEMQRSYLDYAMSVIVSRALPDIRDGLKPSQRRILVAMRDLNLTHRAKHRKCAKITGDTSGNYHPHGDQVIYPTLVHMAQDFSMRYPLVHPQGNFGCFTGETKIKLLDGTEESFAELAKLPADQIFHVYSVDKNGQIVVGEGRHARLTKQKAELVEVVLDSGEVIKCTPDHRFMLRDGSYKQAQDLKAEDILMIRHSEEPHRGDDESRANGATDPDGILRDSRMAVPQDDVHILQVSHILERADVYDITVDTHHNFLLAAGVFVHNSIDGDMPAAQRYTEARMTAISEEMLSDLDKETVDWMPNYDNTRQEPRVLPSKVPQLLMNGSVGIAVGMATNIPPHNLGELCDGLTHLVDNPEAELDDLMQFIKGPDFPTSGIIYNAEDIRTAYATGRGKIVIRGRAEISEGKRGNRIIITEIPFAVNKATLVAKIAELVKEKRIDGISDLRDESDRKGIRVLVELKQSAYPTKVLNQLYDLTQLQSAFYVNMLSLTKDMEPRILNLKEMLSLFLEFRFEVVTRRTQFELKRAEERAHILEGLKIALDHIDEVISTIRASANREVAKQNLIKKFKLSDIQATAILEMRLSALAALERQRVEDELKEKMALIAELKAILADPNRVYTIMKEEFLDLKTRFADERKTEIQAEAIGKFSAEDLIPDEEVIITLTKTNYVKRLPVGTFHAQGRGGKGIVGTGTKDEDTVQELLTARTHDDILFFTNRGRLFQTKVYDIPSVSRQAKGQALVNIIGILPDEKVTAVITLHKGARSRSKYFVMATENGVIKKTEIEAYKNTRKSGIVAIRLQTGDQLQWVKCTSGHDSVFMVSAKGQAILFKETDARPLGRSAAGVRGIKLRAGDKVMSMDVVPKGAQDQTDALIVLENGFGKRTRLDLFTPQGRGGIGIKTANVTPKTGQIIGMHLIQGDGADVLLVSAGGQMIRTPLKSIKRLGRDTQGVTVMRLKGGDKVASVAIIKEDKVEEETAAAATPAVGKRQAQAIDADLAEHKHPVKKVETATVPKAKASAKAVSGKAVPVKPALKPTAKKSPAKTTSKPVAKSVVRPAPAPKIKVNLYKKK